MTQLDMFPPEIEWTPPDALPDLRKYTGQIALDSETHDPHLFSRGPSWCFRGEGRVLGISLAWEFGSGYYPCSHPGENAFTPEQLGSWLQAHFDSGCKFVFAHAAYDLGWFRTLGVKHPDPSKVDDVLIMTPLLDEHRLNYGLDYIGQDYVGANKDTSKIKEICDALRLTGHPAGHLHTLEAKWVADYAEQDAVMTLKVAEHLLPMIHDQGLDDIYQLELDQLPMLLDMRERGMPINVTQVKHYHKVWKEIQSDMTDKIWKLNKNRCRPESSIDVAMALKKEGFDVPRTEKGNVSVTAEVLKQMTAAGSAIAPLVEQHRSYKKNIDFLFNLMDLEWQGRIYPNWRPLKTGEGGTVSGRYSVSNPAVQQMTNPEKSPEFGKAVRSCFESEPNTLWAGLDFGSQEPRITLDKAFMMGLRGASKATNLFQNEPLTDYHQMTADITGLERKPAKTINLGLVYGMGVPKLAAELGVPEDTAHKILKRFDKEIPYGRKLQYDLMDIAKKHGYITTLGGRKCRFLGDIGNREFTHKACNRYVQGTAADQFKLACRDLHKAGFQIMVLMHDELGISVPDTESAIMAAEIMANSMIMNVPHVIDVAIGQNWGDLKEVTQIVGDFIPFQD